MKYLWSYVLDVACDFFGSCWQAHSSILLIVNQIECFITLASTKLYIRDRAIPARVSTNIRCSRNLEASRRNVCSIDPFHIFQQLFYPTNLELGGTYHQHFVIFNYLLQRTPLLCDRPWICQLMLFKHNGRVLHTRFDFAKVKILYMRFMLMSVEIYKLQLLLLLFASTIVKGLIG